MLANIGIIYWLKTELTGTIKDGFVLIIEEHKRLDSVLTLAIDVRLVRNMYLYDPSSITGSYREIQANSSNVISNRADYYFDSLSAEADSLAATHESLVNHQNSDSLFKNAFAKYSALDAMQLIGIDEWDGDKITVQGQTTNTSLEVAIRYLVAKTTSIVGIEREKYDGRSFTSTEFTAWDRNIAFIIKNVINVIRPVLDDRTDQIVDLVLNRADEQENTFIGITCGVVAAVALSLVLLMPFIYRAHTSVMIVFRLFLRLPKKEVEVLIKSAETYLKQVNTHFSAIVKHFNEIDFRDEVKAEKAAIVDAGRQERARRKAGANISNAVANARAEAAAESAAAAEAAEAAAATAAGNEEEKSLAEEANAAKWNAQLEELDLQRKESSIRNASASSRNKLMAEIVGMVMAFGIYFSISISLRISYFTKIRSIIHALDVFESTEPFLSGVILFAIDDMTTQNAMPASGSGIDTRSHNTASISRDKAHRGCEQHHVQTILSEP